METDLADKSRRVPERIEIRHRFSAGAELHVSFATNGLTSAESAANLLASILREVKIMETDLLDKSPTIPEIVEIRERIPGPPIGNETQPIWRDPAWVAMIDDTTLGEAD